MLVEESPWRVIYYDGQSVIAANGDLPQSQRYILAAEAGNLVYPTAKSATHSLAARRLAGSSTSPPDAVMEATVAATKVYPTAQLYQLLLEQLKKKNGLIVAVLLIFQSS